MTKLIKMLAALIAMSTLPAEKRGDDHDARLAKDLKAITDEVKALEESGDITGEGVAELTGQAEQLRKDLDAQAEQIRAFERRALDTQPVMTNLYVQPGVRLQRFSSRSLAMDFCKFCLEVKAASRSASKDMSPVDDSEGGYLIPDAQMESEIIRMSENVGVAEQLGGTVPMGPGGFKQNRQLGGALAYWKAAGAAGTESTPSLGQLNMAPETLICLVDVDMELDEDAMVNVGNYLASQFAYALAYKKDEAAFVGDGSPTYGGITGVLNSDRVTIVDMPSGADTFIEAAYDDMVNLEAAVWEGALVNGQWLMHRTIKAVIKKLKDTANMPIWQSVFGPEPDELLGYPLRTAGLMRGTAATAVSTTFMAFGDFVSGLKIGKRGGIRIDYSDVVGFKNFQKCYRAIERLDIQVNGFTAAEIAANPASQLANPIAVLKTAAS